MLWSLFLKNDCSQQWRMHQQSGAGGAQNRFFLCRGYPLVCGPLRTEEWVWSARLTWRSRLPKDRSSVTLRNVCSTFVLISDHNIYLFCTEKVVQRSICRSSDATTTVKKVNIMITWRIVFCSNCRILLPFGLKESNVKLLKCKGCVTALSTFEEINKCFRFRRHF